MLESKKVDAQTDVGTGVPAIINTANGAEAGESDIAPAAGSLFLRAPTRRSLFMSIAVPALTGVAIAPAAAAAIMAPDPIFAVIAEHKAAVTQWSSHPGGKSYDDEGERESERLFECEQDAFFQVFEVAPTTAAGVAALLEWLAEDEDREGASRIAVIGEYNLTPELGEKAARQLQACAAVLTAV
jgi:hypothetical protein